jgi:hypothetical protein
VTLLAPDAGEIERLAADNGPRYVEFSKTPTQPALETLEDVLSRRRPELQVRFYGFYQEACDLDFLKHIPSVRHLSVDCLWGEVRNVQRIGELPKLRTLGVGIRSLQSVDFLETVPADLETLHLMEATRKALSLKVLRRFQKLRLLYVENLRKDVDTVAELALLEQLTLRSVTVPSLGFLKPLNNLRNLELKLGGTTNLDAFPELAAVRRLEVWMVRKLVDLRVTAEMPELEVLVLQDLPNVTSLPSYSRAAKLKRVTLLHLKSLTDISPVADAPSLEAFALLDARHCTPATFQPLVGHPCLKRVHVGLGSARANAAARDLFAGSRVAVQ